MTRSFSEYLAMGNGRVIRIKTKEKILYTQGLQ